MLTCERQHSSLTSGDAGAGVPCVGTQVARKHIGAGLCADHGRTVEVCDKSSELAADILNRSWEANRCGGDILLSVPLVLPSAWRTHSSCCNLHSTCEGEWHPDAIEAQQLHAPHHVHHVQRQR